LSNVVIPDNKCNDAPNSFSLLSNSKSQVHLGYKISIVFGNKNPRDLIIIFKNFVSQLITDLKEKIAADIYLFFSKKISPQEQNFIFVLILKNK